MFNDFNITTRSDELIPEEFKEVEEERWRGCILHHNTEDFDKIFEERRPTQVAFTDYCSKSVNYGILCNGKVMCACCGIIWNKFDIVAILPLEWIPFDDTIGCKTSR